MHVPGSAILPLLRYERWRDAVRREAASREVVGLCRTGFRSSIAVSLLQRDGVPAGRASDLAGGWAALEGAGACRS